MAFEVPVQRHAARPGLPSQDRAAAPRICRASLPLVRASVYFRNTQ